jgi:hypothetical protein
MPVFAGVGIVAWCIAALIIWSAARVRFEKLTNRAEIERPIRPPLVSLRVTDASSKIDS